MPQFRVIVPPSVKEGQLVQAYVGPKSARQLWGSSSSAAASSDAVGSSNPPPRTVAVRIPPGAKAGDAVVFELTHRQIEQYWAPGDSPHSKSSGNNSPSNSPLAEPLLPPVALPGKLVTSTRLRNNVYRELCSEICLGFLIGMSLVVGFLAGVLHVTDHEHQPLQPHSPLVSQPLHHPLPQ